MENKFSTLRYVSPPKQALLVFGISLLFIGGGWLLNRMRILEGDPLFAWSVATAFMLLFAVINSLMSLSATSTLRYWRDSVYSYIGLAALNALAAWGVSGIAIGDAGSYKWIYFVITFSFLVFLSMVNLMKRIVQFAEREEWNRPRQKR